MTALPARRVGANRPQPPPSRRPQLRLVGPPRHARRYLVMMVLVVVPGFFGSVALNALAAEQSFAHRELVRDVDALNLRVDELTVSVARLESPDRIRRTAERRLGMVPAEQPAFLALQPARASSRVASRPPDTGG